MFNSKIEKDNYKNEQKHYYLTQGDSCTITATPYKNGEVTSTSSCMFKLAGTDYVQVFSKPFEKVGNSYTLNLDSIETEKLNPGTYIYEIEYTLNNNEKQTPHSWYFDIIKQITEQ